MKERSFDPVATWYDKIVGNDGHHYHRQVILPNLLKRFVFEKVKNPKLLDLACGNGFLAANIPKNIYYEGVDNSTSLLKQAKQQFKHPFTKADLAKPLSLQTKNFTHATCILALQNIICPEVTIQSAKRHLLPGGKFFLVLNHPCFRIPRQSHWGFDTDKNLQYRRLDRYLSPLDIPIHFKEKGKAKESVMSYHNPISFYVNALSEAGFAISHMSEWCSLNLSTGKKAKAENRARKEFPLFLFIEASSLE